MTVTTTAFVAGPYTITGSAALPVPFRFIRAEDLRVTRVSGGITTTLTLWTDYSVSGDWVTNGGSVTLTPPVVGSQVTITRVTDVLQPQVYQQSSRFPSAAHERALDKLTMVAQETSSIAAAASAAVSQQAGLIVDLQTNMTTVLASIGNMAASISALSSSISAVQTSVNANTNSIDLLNTSQTTQNNQITALEGRLSALDNAPQIISINYSPSSGITLETLVLFNATLVSALPILEWNWNFYAPGGIFLSSSSNVTPSFAGAEQIHVRARNATGWSPYRGISITISGGAAPVVSDIAAVPSTGLTTATLVAFSYTASGSPTSQAWVFKTNGAQVGSSSLASPSFTFTSAGTARAEVTATNANGTSAVYGEDIGTVTGGGTSRIIDHLANNTVDHLGNFIAHA